MSSCVLDTSVILGWLKDEGYDVHAAYVDLGQPCEDRDAVMQKARQCGAKSARIVDAQEELCRDFAFPVLMWGAKYESIYLMGTSIAYLGFPPWNGTSDQIGARQPQARSGSARLAADLR